MKKLPKIITHLPTKGKDIYLVFACAWCPPSSYTKLKENEYYTHGICSYHKETFLSDIRSRISAMKMRAKKGSRYNPAPFGAGLGM